MKTKHLTLEKILTKKMKDPEFRIYFEESRHVSQICNAVTHARQTVGLSQAELAKKVGTTQSVIARLENGNQHHVPSLKLLGRIAQALGFSLIVGFEKNKAA